MGYERFVIEFGTGADLHGEDVTKAAQRAVKDAVSHSCLCGLVDIFGYSDPNKMHIEVKIGCPYPERVNKEEVLKMLPFGTANLEVVAGGLLAPGLKLPALGEGDRVVLALAALTVYVDTGGIKKS
ncbi:MAG: Lin0512 family protein [Peptococcaceae bacterium]|nr:Lin0512 family protein [Peptococcaceae bacterium]MDH7524676.1 Lin0512 family protein [Peptococcaceae bacterium]